MTAREPDPIAPKRCPRCASPDPVSEATAHEQDRTGCGWWCSACDLFFEGTASEFHRLQAKAIADAAERTSSTPTRTTEGAPE